MDRVTGQKYLPAGLPRPAYSPTALDAPYWDGAKSHRLMVQVCAQCGAAEFPPEEICSACHSFDRQWAQTSGTGTIASWSRIWHPVHPALQDNGPYVVVVVDLDDYPVKMVGNLLGDPLEEVTIGTRLQVCFEDQPEDDYTLIQWERVDVG